MTLTARDPMLVTTTEEGTLSRAPSDWMPDSHDKTDVARPEAVRRLERRVTRRRAKAFVYLFARFGFYPIALIASTIGLVLGLFAATLAYPLFESFLDFPFGGVLQWVISLTLIFLCTGLPSYLLMRLKGKVDKIAASNQVEKLMTQVRIMEVEQAIKTSPAGGALHGLTVSDESTGESDGKLSVSSSEDGAVTIVPSD